MKVAIESMGTGASAFKFLYVDAECQQYVFCVKQNSVL